MLGSSLTGVKIKKVVGAREHFCALDVNGKIHTWGGNTYGELGINSLTSAYLPTSNLTNNINNIGNGIVISDIMCGNYHTLRVDTSNRIWAFGEIMQQVN